MINMAFMIDKLPFISKNYSDFEFEHVKISHTSITVSQARAAATATSIFFSTLTLIKSEI